MTEWFRGIQYIHSYHRVSLFDDLFLRCLNKDSFTFTHPIFPLPGYIFRLNASLGKTFRFTHHRYQWCMGRLGTVLDTGLEESVPHSSFGSFVYRGFQPFVRHRVAPKTGKLYDKELV
ncbi:hypothetical protein GTQ43_34670 [Nostoc sp. KVJ3]|uniref:hypothetical protein n=1 Tax=Nostoc sp. KVJ3 TaxID=457945 RepID=UPI002237BE33|nr:hypothetical protein [Nostoc sp. KVJ3]MCW5318643.1 hypothetical protein [Nostoc sp. KVJ3]